MLFSFLIRSRICSCLQLPAQQNPSKHPRVLATGVKYWNKLGSRWPCEIPFIHIPRYLRGKITALFFCSSHRHSPPCLFQYFTPVASTTSRRTETPVVGDGALVQGLQFQKYCIYLFSFYSKLAGQYMSDQQ